MSCTLQTKTSKIEGFKDEDAEAILAEFQAKAAATDSTEVSEDMSSVPEVICFDICCCFIVYKLLICEGYIFLTVFTVDFCNFQPL